jgi:hypothetical protein
MQPETGRRNPAPTPAAANVPDGGEATQQCLSGSHRHDGVEVVWLFCNSVKVRAILKEMEMGIDQTRHQGALAAVDHRGALSRDRLGRGRLDQVAFDQHVGVLEQGLAHPVEHIDVAEECLRHSLGILRESRSRESSEQGRRKADGHRAACRSHLPDVDFLPLGVAA